MQRELVFVHRTQTGEYGFTGHVVDKLWREIQFERMLRKFSDTHVKRKPPRSWLRAMRG